MWTQNILGPAPQGRFNVVSTLRLSMSLGRYGTKRSTDLDTNQAIIMQNASFVLFLHTVIPNRDPITPSGHKLAQSTIAFCSPIGSPTSRGF